MKPLVKKDSEIIAKLIQDSVTIVTAESCTGGLIAHRITEVAGSSAAFWGGWVTYDNRAKIQLGVSSATLDRFGAVSQEVAVEMAQSAWRKVALSLPEGVAQTKKICAIATTGVAGPGGGTEKKPVGLCCIAIAWGASHVKSFEIHAPSGASRSDTKKYFADQALAILAEAPIQ
jgi:PncC family amidohydrolase